MAGIKISELPEASTLTGSELVAIVQDNCTKYVCTCDIGATSSSDIVGIITGCGLVGGGTSGTVCVAIDNNCFDSFKDTTTTVDSFSASWDQSTCAGIACTGDVNTTGTQTIGGSKTFTSTICAPAIEATTITLTSLPTSDPGGSGIVWNDGGTLKIT